MSITGSTAETSKPLPADGEKPPEPHVYYWGRNFGDPISYGGGTHTYLAYGVRGSGKSALLECIGEQHLRRGHGVFDLWGARSGEGLAWLRSQWAEEGRVLLLHGDNTSVASSFDSKNVSKYRNSDLEKYDLVISASPLYSSLSAEFEFTNQLIDRLYKRQHWRKPIYLLVREAANLLYSRAKISENQKATKYFFIYFLREARHCGVSLGIDSQRFTAVDTDVRSTIDYVFFKSLGHFGLPKEYRFLYRSYLPQSLQSFAPQYFLVFTRYGSHGLGEFPLPRFHKRPGEDLLKILDIEVEHGEEQVQHKPGRRVGDLKHAELIALRVDGYSHRQIAEKLGVASSTVYEHIRYHNEGIQRKGVCLRCKRAKAPHLTELIE